MFDLAELYTAWTEDPDAFWGTPEITQEQLQAQLLSEPESVLDENVWASVVVCSCPPPGTHLHQAREWLGVAIEGLKIWSQRVVNGPGIGAGAGADAAASDAIDQYVDNCREALEKYLFLTRLHLARLDKELDEISQPARLTAGTVSASLRPVSSQIIELLDAVSRTLVGGLESVFPATASAKRASLALLYLEPSCRLLQRELVVKDVQLVKQIVRVLALGVKLQHQQSMLRTQLLQLLTYYDHAVDAVILVLVTLREQFDHTSLAEALLRDLAAEAMSWTETNNSATVTRAKTVGAFLSGLTRAMPDLMAANLGAVSPLLEAAAPQLRQAMLDASAGIVHTILSPTDRDNLEADTDPSASIGAIPQLDEGAGPMRYKPAFDLVKLVELRVNDVSHFCRLRAVQALVSLSVEPALISRREQFTAIAVSKMKDRTQLVRRQAMRLMKQLIETHPSIMNEGNLSLGVWRASLAQVDEQLSIMEQGIERQQLEAAQAYIAFTLRFIHAVNSAVQVAQHLLLSRTKSDILDAIDLLVYADAYRIEASAKGIRSIIHLVWAKADNDEENQVCKAAVNTYAELFFSTGPDIEPRRATQIVAENLIGLTRGASQGELTSLERLLVLAMEADLISVPVVGRLWGLYQTELDIDPARRRGAAIILSMLSLGDRSIARSGLSAVVSIGLSREYGLADLELAQYSCAILKRALEPESSSESVQRLPANYELFDNLIQFVLQPATAANSMAWAAMVKEALAAINVMSDSPSKLYTRLVQEYVDLVFGEASASQTEVRRQLLFAQLLFIVGEVALNLLVYLERSELEFKRRNQALQNAQSATLATGGLQENEAADAQSGGSPKKSEAEKEEELMAGGGSAEDDFLDVLRDIREEGILYSDRALLKPFTTLLTDICRAELQRSDEQGSRGGTGLAVIGATQSLAKFMCVSSRFCRDNLQLLVDLMSRHDNNVVRSNFVVALGDVAICFNGVIDEQTEYLYDRLNDRDEVVQRTCIVALTFLILAGQIKVKGKLGEMAKAVTHPNRKISMLATMFFRELAAKDNAIYNSFLDMLSTVIADETVPDRDMLRIVKFLAEFITKERQIKQISDKLVARLPRAETKRQWSAYAQVIKSMPQKLEDLVKDLIARGFQRLPGDRTADDDDDDDLVDEPEDVTSAGPASRGGGSSSTPAETADFETSRLDIAVGDLSLVQGSA